jgi:N-acetylglucosaminyldiphosphoundecaprenol N-acetyl-beta-D-mannosaminyltransferase
VDVVDTAAALQRMDAALAAGRPTHMCTINLDFIAGARADPEFMRILNESALNTPDGFPIVWLGRLQGCSLKERVAGADLIPRLMTLAARRRARVFLMGGEGGVAQAAARRLTQRLPDLKIAGWYEPPRARIEDMDNEAIVAQINASRADVLLVALGNPKQEKWIDRYMDRLHVSLAIGVGCCLDLIAGRMQRAPSWMRASGTEWLYRLTREPRRLFRRYLNDLWCLTRLALPLVWQRVTRLIFPPP